MKISEDNHNIARGLTPQPTPISFEAACSYCKNMAKTHYENFFVGSILVPHKYLQHLYNIYAFCRCSDDLADEIGDRQRSLELLEQWRTQLKSCYNGTPTHPALIALQNTIKEFDIPPQPFDDLISAFEQDCKILRYDTYEDLLDYCSRSANPVGRLYLWIFGYKDQVRQKLSDKICTGLQLANFWQDVVPDFRRGRIYLPREDMLAFGCSELDIAQGRMSPQFAELMRFEINRTKDMFNEATPLASMVNHRLGIDVALFRRAGLSILEEIAKNNYDVINRRPTLTKAKKIRLFIGCLFGLK